MNFEPKNEKELEAELNLSLNPFSPETKIIEPPPLWFSKRLLVVVLMFLCYFNIAIIRCNISIAVVDMTSPKNIRIGNSTETKPAEFDWDSRTVGFILSIYYYGGLASLGGGYVVTKFGAAISCMASLLLCGVTMILNPISVYCSFYFFMICRLLVGIFESFITVSAIQLCSKWIPTNDKPKLMSFIITGSNVGIAIVHVLCGFLATQWNWQMIFYVTGSISVMTSLLCSIFLKNQPSEDNSISKKELAYILDGTVNAISSSNRVVHPYRKILSSGPVWALLGIQFAYMWIATILFTLLPLYIKDLTRGSTNTVGQISSFTNLVNIFMLPIFGILLNYAKNFHISTTKMHKILLGGAYIIINALFVATALISNFIVILISFILIQMLLSIIILLISILRISIAPKNSSVIAGLCLFMSAMSCILARSVTGFMTINHSMSEWNDCFIVASIISSLAGIIFTLYGSSEAQPWSTSLTTDKN